ncbi:MAG TPA: glycosyltransferase family 2 protein [Acidimicrobiia bacterium]|nr:glycosyltransferase family 2 protein [Acidimicrobiia bacterium]
MVVPTYRSGPALGELLDRLRAALAGVDYEVVIVNDASPDDTWERLEALAPEHPELIAVDLLANRGQALATLCGVAHARGDLVASMDDDLQHPPEELPRLLEALAANPRWDAVVGTWPRDRGFVRTAGSWLFGWIDRLAHGTPKGFRHTAFRVMRRPLVDALLSHESRTPLFGPLLTQMSSEVHNVPVAHDARKHGSSTLSWRAGARQVADNLIHGTTLPLRLLSRFGLLFSALALVLGIVFFARWLAGADTPPGWASVFMATVFFGGAALFGLGLLGEYVGLIIQEVRRPPRWSVRRVIGNPRHPAD